VVAHPLPELPDVWRIALKPHGDARGFFVERWTAAGADALGIPELVQLNHSRSRRGTLRGLHFQAPPHAQGKLVGVVRGSIYDVVVDIRRGSTTYGRAAGIALDEAAHELLWIPPGFAHGFLVTSEEADVLYQTTTTYAPQAEGGLAWDDPALGIPWPLPAGVAPTLSPRDLTWPTLAKLVSPFTYS
jgi:dTDP-4-dehydrorhamnose 3,5-epimerase